ncbi:unnamed protein product [Mytilus coruscus]|uniref:Uncharacterized protein n=1 Tax=Mytilus coruscus TaxID=42192 RepID=A0A6J8EYC2_MYTCO|nr:unnamed protein product [Mytilus coruscus]
MDKNFKKWSRAVWKEADQEEEGVVPSIWISVSEDVVMWARGINAIRAMKELRHPDKKWERFELIKVKITSDSRTECDEFGITTTAEVSDEESENELEMGKRIQKKKTYDEFVTDANDLQEKVAPGNTQEKVASGNTQEKVASGNTQEKVASGTTKKTVTQQTKLRENQKELPDPPAPPPSASQSTSSGARGLDHLHSVRDPDPPDIRNQGARGLDNLNGVKDPDPPDIRDQGTRGLDHLHGARDPDPPDVTDQDLDHLHIIFRGQDPDPQDIWGHNCLQDVPIQGLLQEIDRGDPGQGLLSNNQELVNIHLNKRRILIPKDKKEMMFSFFR